VKQKATNPVERIRLIARLALKLTTQFAFGSSFQSASDSFRSRSAPAGVAPKAAKMRVRVNSVNCVRKVSFDFLGHCHFDFSVKIFFCATKNKIQFFSCRSRRRFLISSPLAGRKGRRCE